MSTDDFKNIVEAIAISCAGLAVVHWWIRGSFYPSLKLTLNVERTPSNDDQDVLVVSLCMENPGKTSLSLEHIKLSYTQVSDANLITNEHSIPMTREKINDETPQFPINLATSDATHIGAMFVAPQENSYIISALIVARKPRFRSSKSGRGMQWRASRAVPRIVGS